MTDPKCNSEPLPSQPPIDPQPFLKSAAIYRWIGFAVMAAWVIHFCIFLYTGGAQAVTTFGAFAAVAAIYAGYAVLIVFLMTCSGLLESRAESALAINAVRAVFPSSSAYVLLLRSFRSQIVSEKLSTTYATGERDEVKYIRAEPYLTGKKITTYETRTVGQDDVRDFLVSAVGASHVVMVDGVARNISAKPFCLLSNEQQWWAVVEQLAADAQLIAVVPEASESLEKEIRVIVSKNLHKALFMMPPSRPAPKQGEPYISGMTRRDRWTESIATLAITLPEYSESGAILACQRGDASLVGSPYTRETLAQLIADHQADGIPLSAALRTLNEKELLAPMLDELAKREAYLAKSHSWTEYR